MIAALTKDDLKARVGQWLIAAGKNFPELTTFHVPVGWEDTVRTALNDSGASYTMQTHLGNVSVTIGPGIRSGA